MMPTTFEVPEDAVSVLIAQFEKAGPEFERSAEDADNSEDRHGYRRTSELATGWAAQLRDGATVEFETAQDEDVFRALAGDDGYRGGGAFELALNARRWEDVRALAGVFVALDATEGD